MKRITKLLSLTACIGLAGCAAVQAYPDASTDYKAEIQALNKYLQPDVIVKYDSPNDSDRDGQSKQAWRDNVVNARVRAIDLEFNRFQQRLFEEGVGSGIATDWTVLGLNAAGALATSGAANALSAASAVLVGGKAAFDKHAYFEKTMPALVATMAAKRKDVLVRIRAGLLKKTDDYPLTVGLTDVESYYDAGSIPGAIVEVTQNAGEMANNADAELERIAVVTVVPADLQSRREQIAAYVKTLGADQLDTLAQSLRLRTGAAALGDVLTAITKAQTPEAVDVIAQRTKVLFGKEL